MIDTSGWIMIVVLAAVFGFVCGGMVTHAIRDRRYCQWCDKMYVYKSHPCPSCGADMK